MISKKKLHLLPRRLIIPRNYSENLTQTSHARDSLKENHRLDPKIFNKSEKLVSNIAKNVDRYRKYRNNNFNFLSTAQEILDKADPHFLGDGKDTFVKFYETEYVEKEFFEFERVYKFRTKVRVYLPQDKQTGKTLLSEEQVGNNSSNFTNPKIPKIIALHGGGYCLCTIDRYHRCYRSLSNELGAIIYAIDYQRAPKYAMPHSLNECIAVSKAILNENENKSMTIFGDSAGGHAGLNAIFELADLAEADPENSKQHLPKNGIFMYPWITINKTAESYYQSLSVNCHYRKILASFILNHIDEVEYNLATENLYLQLAQGDSVSEMISKSDDPHLSSQINFIKNYINQPKMSIDMRPDLYLKKFKNQDINLQFFLSNLDALYDEGVEFTNRLKNLSSNSNSTSKIENVTCRGTTHAWFQLFASQSRYGYRIKDSWTPMHDEEYDRVIGFMRRFLE